MPFPLPRISGEAAISHTGAPVPVPPATSYTIHGKALSVARSFRYAPPHPRLPALRTGKTYFPAPGAPRVVSVDVPPYSP